MTSTLLRGDCLDLMEGIADASIDLILADLPYGTTRMKWDVIIPFEPLWAHYKRILSPYAAVLLMAKQPFSSMVISSNLQWYKYEWVWRKKKPTNIFQAKVRPLCVHENILVFTREPLSNRKNIGVRYYPQGVEASKQRIAQKPRETVNYSSRKSHGSSYAYQGTNYPRSVLEFSGDDDGAHATQKPVKLCEYLINTYTRAGETVLDNCMGSGTTGVACKNTGRNFIGMEKEQKYFDIARQRIESA